MLLLVSALVLPYFFKDQPPCRDDKNEAAKQRPEESDHVIVDEDAASASPYMVRYQSISLSLSQYLEFIVKGFCENFK